MVGIYPLNSIAVVGESRLQPGLVLLVVKFYHYAPDRALLEVSSHSFQDKKFCSFNVNLYQVNATTVQIVEPSLDDLDRWSVLDNASSKISILSVSRVLLLRMVAVSGLGSTATILLKFERNIRL